MNKSHFADALAMLAKSMSKTEMSPESVEKEIGVIKTEKSNEESSHDVLSWNLLNKAFYAPSRLSGTVIGEYDEIGNTTVKGLQGFKEKHYTGDRMTLVVVGDVDHAKVCDMVGKKFQSIPKSRANLTHAFPKAQTRAGYESVENNALDQIVLKVAYQVDGREKGLRENSKSALVASMLGGDLGAPLSKNLRDGKGIVYNAGSYFNAEKDVGRLIIHTACLPENARKVVAGITEEVNGFIENMTESDLAGIKKSWIGERERRDGNPAEKGSDLSMQTLYYGGEIPVDAYRKMLDSISVGDVQKHAREIFSRLPAVAVYGKDVKRSLSQEDINALPGFTKGKKIVGAPATELEKRLGKTVGESIPTIADRYIAANKGEKIITAKRLQGAFTTWAAGQISSTQEKIFPTYYEDFRSNKHALQKSIYEKYLAADAITKRVILTGPTASGKTTFLETHRDGQTVSNDPTILCDDNAIKDGNDFRCAKNIQKPLEVICVYRDILSCAESYVGRFSNEWRLKTVRNYPKKYGSEFSSHGNQGGGETAAKGLSIQERAGEFVDSYIGKLDAFLALPPECKGAIYYNRAPARAPFAGRSQALKANVSPQAANNVAQRHRVLRRSPAYPRSMTNRPTRRVQVGRAQQASPPAASAGQATVQGRGSPGVFKPQGYYTKRTPAELAAYLEEVKKQRSYYEKKITDLFRSSPVFQQGDVLARTNSSQGR